VYRKQCLPLPQLAAVVYHTYSATTESDTCDDDRIIYHYGTDHNGDTHQLGIIFHYTHGICSQYFAGSRLQYFLMISMANLLAQ